MILKKLHEYAEEEKLLEGMEVGERLVHLVLTLSMDGKVSTAAPWSTITREVRDAKAGTIKSELGRVLRMPEFPGVNNGGKANFLADSCDKVLGLNAKTGEFIPDDPARGGNATKAFLHFWKRIEDAHEATGLPELAALLEFRNRYLADEEARRAFPFVGMVPLGKDAKPTFCTLGPANVPLDRGNITFQVGTDSGPLFKEDSPLHDYWKQTFHRERFAESATQTAPSSRGVCLITGAADVPIAESHRTLIKGVPGLPPIGGYVVSFDKSSPAFTSYGLEGGWNAPVSETAAAAYALALNRLLADENCRRRFGGAVMVSWIDLDRGHTLSGAVNGFFLNMPPLKDEASAFFRDFEVNGKYHASLNTQYFHSITLAANGGRVVVRRWLDEPLTDAIGALKVWFDHLETVPIAIPSKAARPSDTPSAAPFSPLSIYALAATTARVPSEVPDGVYDALYRAAFDRVFNPRALLAPVLQRVRIAAAQTGDGVRFKTSHFALLKLILIRSQENPMENLTPQLCETSTDPAYNCGRLLAVLDDLQLAAQGRVGAGIVARFYGNASTFPRNVFPVLLKHARPHLAKLRKDPKKAGAASALEARINGICGLFTMKPPAAAPEFPGLLSPLEQGRFALGFHQQKGREEFNRRRAAELKKQTESLGAEDADAAAIADAIATAESANDAG